MDSAFLFYLVLRSDRPFISPFDLPNASIKNLVVGSPHASSLNNSYVQAYRELEFFSVPTKGKSLYAYGYKGERDSTKESVQRWLNNEAHVGPHFLYVAQTSPFNLHSFQSSKPLYLYGLYTDYYDVLAVSDIENLDDIVKLTASPVQPWVHRFRTYEKPNFSINVGRTTSRWQKWKQASGLNAAQRFSVLESHILSQCRASNNE